MLLVLRVPDSEDVDAAKQAVIDQLPKERLSEILVIAIPATQDIFQIVQQGA